MSQARQRLLFLLASNLTGQEHARQLRIPSLTKFKVEGMSCMAHALSCDPKERTDLFTTLRHLNNIKGLPVLEPLRRQPFAVADFLAIMKLALQLLLTTSTGLPPSPRFPQRADFGWEMPFSLQRHHPSC